MDEKMTILTGAPFAGVSAHVAGMRSTTAPVWTEQGTGLSFAGYAVAPNAAARIRVAAAHTAQVAVAGARSTDLPGPIPRGAPV